MKRFALHKTAMTFMAVFFVLQAVVSYGHELTNEAIERMEWQCVEQIDPISCQLLGEEGLEPAIKEESSLLEKRRSGFLYYVEGCNQGDLYSCDLVGYFLLKRPEVTNYSGDPKLAAQKATFYLARACGMKPQFRSACTLLLEAVEKGYDIKVKDETRLAMDKLQCYRNQSAVECLHGAWLAAGMMRYVEAYALGTLACLRGMKEGCKISDQMKRSISKSSTALKKLSPH
ncbi:hypothetical protein D6779_04505 [Candidatus Parcubacteria bacterium]|nr:MAG: hypothetical protein D6779_04505 [Candidatus Parcubacteria bacterium]